MSWEAILSEATMLISIIISVILGFTIGYERKYRAKEAGIRTHTIVCFGSALMMLVSKYAFTDVLDYDPTRIAAQIVSGVGFLGSGIIMYRKNQVHGLTTAAGVWSTAGIGMAAGAQMYTIAIGSTLILVLVQCLLHININLFRNKQTYRLRIDFNDNGDIDSVKELFGVKRFHNIILNRSSEGITYHAVLYTDQEFSSQKLNDIMHEHPYIIVLERCDED